MTEIATGIKITRRKLFPIAGGLLLTAFGVSLRGSIPPPIRLSPLLPNSPQLIPEPDKAPSVSNEPPTYVYLPGATAEKNLLTDIRNTLHTEYGDNVIVPASISGPASLKKGENIDTHHLHLAETIAEKGSARDVHVVAHSFGGFESLDVVNKLLNQTDWHGNEVKLTFMGVPGFVESGFSAVVESFKRFSQIPLNYALVEQHTAYPLPELFYSTHATVYPAESKTIFKDSPEERGKRRLFFEQFLQKMTPQEAQNIQEKLTKIETDMVNAINTSNEEKFTETLNMRAKVVEPYIQDLFNGKQMPQELHDKYIALYKETADDIAPGIEYYPQFLLYLAKVEQYTQHGIPETLKEIVEAAKKKGVTVKVNFALLERDRIIKPEDIDNIKRGFDVAGLASILGDFSFIETFAHSSVGYEPEVLKTVFAT